MSEPKSFRDAVLSKPVWGWAFYDFGNSAFATSILSVIFNVYFAHVLVPKEGAAILGFQIPGESLWGYLISTVMLCVLILSPALGALADKKNLKKRFLVFSAGIGSVATMALFFAVPGRLGYAIMMSFVAILGYELSLVFYNAFLTDIADEKRAGRVSGFGFALGYVGGGLCLALNLGMIAKPELFGMSAGAASLPSGVSTLPTRASVLVAGLWWLLFTLPAILLLRENFSSVASVAASTAQTVLHSFRQLKTSLADIRGRPDLSRFLLAFLIYDDGIQTILLMASIFGAKELEMKLPEIIACYLMIQFVAFGGAVFWGKVADAWNHKNVILCTLAIYVGIVVWGLVMKHIWEFWVLGVIVGIVMGGSQAASRSLFALLIPPGQAGEFFAFFSIVGKAAALVGPCVFGVASQMWGIRAGVGSLLIFFLIGGAVLLTVNEFRGRTDGNKLKSRVQL